MTADQDPIVARALSDLDVPEHAPDFWERLDERLEETALAAGDSTDAVASETTVNGPTPIATVTAASAADGVDLRDRIDLRDTGPRHAASTDPRTSTGELPSIAELRPPATAPRRQKIWFAAAAALLVVAASSIALALRGGDDDPETATPASESTATSEASTFSSSDTDPTAPPSTPTPSPTTTTSAPSVPGATGSAAEAVVIDWLTAVGTGDMETAAALTGPRSTAYIESRGPDASVEGMILESGEGYGAMPAAPDLEIQELRLGQFDFGEVSLVAVTGTHGGEGSEGQRQTFVFPVVTNGSEAVVEPWTAPPGSLEVTLPEAAEDGSRVLPADEAVELFAPIDGTVFFSVDDAVEGIRPVETSEVAGAPFARYDPPGALASGDHIAIVGFVSPDGAMLLGEAVPFGVS